MTLTVSEAIALGFCDGEYNTPKEALAHCGIADYTIKKQNLSVVDRIIGLLINPAVSGLLILVIFGGIYFELQSPGIGFPILAAIIAAILYFMPLYLEGLAANWEILIFIVGLILIALELFVIPGFGGCWHSWLNIGNKWFGLKHGRQCGVRFSARRYEVV